MRQGRKKFIIRFHDHSYAKQPVTRLKVVSIRAWFVCKQAYGRYLIPKTFFEVFFCNFHKSIFQKIIWKAFEFFFRRFYRKKRNICFLFVSQEYQEQLEEKPFFEINQKKRKTSL